MINKLNQNTMADYKIWMSYDLGLGPRAEGMSEEEYRNEYQKRSEKLHQWLHEHNALECGDSVAYIDGYTRSSGSIDEVIKSELKAKGIGEVENIRVYIIAYNIAVSPTDKNSNIEKIEFAGFIFGARRKAPWEEEQEQYRNIDIGMLIV